MSKILGLNDTQGGVVAMIFKYCDDKKLPLLDLKDFIKVLQYVGNEGKTELQAIVWKYLNNFYRYYFKESDRITTAGS